MTAVMVAYLTTGCYLTCEVNATARGKRELLAGIHVNCHVALAVLSAYNGIIALGTRRLHIRYMRCATAFTWPHHAHYALRGTSS